MTTEHILYLPITVNMDILKRNTRLRVIKCFKYWSPEIHTDDEISTYNNIAGTLNSHHKQTFHLNVTDIVIFIKLREILHIVYHMNWAQETLS